MALVVLLRGVNVGGHRRFRPSLLARALREYGVVNIGAAGTFVVRRPGSRAAFRDALRRLLPFDAHIILCEGRELLRLAAAIAKLGSRNAEQTDPKYAERGTKITCFAAFFAKPVRAPAQLPLSIPASGPWFVRIVTVQGRCALGLYRRDMKTIGYLGQMDKLFGSPATIRNWNTVLAIARVLEGEMSNSEMKTKMPRREKGQSAVVANRRNMNRPG